MQLVAEVFLLSLSLTKIEELLDFVFDSAQNLIDPKKKTIDCLLSMKKKKKIKYKREPLSY